MLTRRLVILAASAALLAGCVSTRDRQNALAAADVRALRLVGVKGAFAADSASIEWAAPLDAYNKEHPDRPAVIQAYKRVDDGRVYTSISTPEALAYAERAFDERVRRIMGPALAAELAGSRPVRAVVTARRVFVPRLGAAFVASALGATPQTAIVVEIDLLDAKTGASIVRYGPSLERVDGGDSLIDFGNAGRYSADGVERVLAQTTTRYLAWLLPS